MLQLGAASATEAGTEIAAAMSAVVSAMAGIDLRKDMTILLILWCCFLAAVQQPAEALARCQPKDSYFGFIDLLFRNQDKWDPENGVTDVHGALLSLSRIAGMSAEQADACMNNQDEQKRIMAVAQDASARYGITGTPTLIINGEVEQAGGMPWTVLKSKLDSLLAKK